MAKKDTSGTIVKSISLKDNPPGYYYQEISKQIKTVWQNVGNLPDQDQALIEQVEKEDTVEFLFRNSIILIQGQAGTHKSRLAGIIVSALLANDTTKMFLNFRVKQTSNTQTKVIYIDTERNLKYQLPMAIKKIIEDAGIKLESAADVIAPFPLLNVPREHRLKVVELLLSTTRQKELGHVCIVIDVVSDCIGDFNFLTEVYKLTDGLNMLINNHDVTIISILHENPGSEKARGHLGTELTNKASTVIQISEYNDPATFKVSILKNRNRRRSKSVFVKFDNSTNTLELIDDEIAITKLENLHVAKILLILKEYPAGSKIMKDDLFAEISKKIGIEKRTIESQVKAIVEGKIPFDGFIAGKKHYLIKKRSKRVSFEIQVEEF